MQILTKTGQNCPVPTAFAQRRFRNSDTHTQYFSPVGRIPIFFSFTAVVKLEPEGQEKEIMCPVQPQQSHTGGRSCFFGKSTQPCPPANVWSEGSCFAPKKYGKDHPQLQRKAQGKSWAELGVEFGDSILPPSPALCQNMGKALREFRGAKVSSFSLSLERFPLIPWAGLHPAVLQHKEMECAGEIWSTQETLQDKKTSSHRKLPVPIQTKKK